jgi:uncharacterized membrane protein
MSQSHIDEHIDLIAKHEQDFLIRRTPSERLGDTIAGFAGSLRFVCIHLAVFASWMIFNAASSTHPRHFDPPPFPLLGTLVALEAILLASIILMLQILLLTEKEITAVLAMDRKIAGQVGLQRVANDKELEQLSQHTSIDDVAQTLKDKLPSE